MTIKRIIRQRYGEIVRAILLDGRHIILCKEESNKAKYRRRLQNSLKEFQAYNENYSDILN